LIAETKGDLGRAKIDGNTSLYSEPGNRLESAEFPWMEIIFIASY
jgi:hypothetical protein